jgi:hypothetical protein
MIIENIDPERKSFSEYSLQGNILTIGGVAIDLATEEGEQEVRITLGCCNGMVHRGLMTCCTYVADVIIPPRRYETVVTERSPDTDDGDTDEAPTTRMESVPLPLDIESVILRLWPVVDEAEGEHQMIEGEYDVAE